MHRVMEWILRMGAAHRARATTQSGGRCPPYCAMAIISTVLTLSAVCGCGGPAYEYDSTVTGTVTIDGDLAKSGTVTFHPAEKGQPAIGRIHSDGSYSLRTGQGDMREVDGGTVIPGEYAVTVAITGPSAPMTAEGGPPIPGPSLIASKYSRKETTDLHHTVKPGKQVIVLSLEKFEPGSAPKESSEELATDPAAESTDDNTTTESASEQQEKASDTATPDDPPSTGPPAEIPTEKQAQ